MNDSYKTKLTMLGSSVGKILLVAGLVLTLGWALVQIAQWKNRKPTIIEAGADGKIILLADTAKIIGAGEARTNFYKGKRNIGWWDETTQSLSWQVDVAQSGTYRVLLEYSLPKGKQTEFKIQIAGRILPSSAAPTGGWGNWGEMDVGVLKLDAGEDQQLTLNPIRSRGKGIMNFVSLKLEPVQ